MTISLTQFQKLIRDAFDVKDRQRGVEGTFMWFIEEIGELSSALRNGTHEEQSAEMADVLAWLASLANILEIDLEKAVLEKYGTGCPVCRQSPCTCDQLDKP